MSSIVLQVNRKEDGQVEPQAWPCGLLWTSRFRPFEGDTLYSLAATYDSIAKFAFGHLGASPQRFRGIAQEARVHAMKLGFSGSLLKLVCKAVGINGDRIQEVFSDVLFTNTVCCKSLHFRFLLEVSSPIRMPCAILVALVRGK